MSDTTHGGDEPQSDQDYEVGYRKPPAHRQFRRGQSGNPRGRPRGVRNFSTDVKQVSQMPVVLVEGGKRKQTSTQHGVLLKLREGALKGDQRSLNRLLELSAKYNDAPAPAAGLTPVEDQAIVADYEARVIARHEAARLAASAAADQQCDQEEAAVMPEMSATPHNDAERQEDNHE